MQRKEKKVPSAVNSVPQFGGWDQKDPAATNYSMVFAQARANRKSMKSDLSDSLKRSSLGSEEDLVSANASPNTNPNPIPNPAQGKSPAHANANANVSHQDEPLGM
ncbi:hypothetical protein PIB30_038915, partial [Stylosanthes scabra]|nr:hypothetical protein [Stylosanthes scabra]